MNPIIRTISMFFVISFLICGVMIIEVHAAPILHTNGKIAFTSDRDGNSEIYLMNADGTGQTRLTNNSFRDDYPTWSPDGRQIAFLRQSKGVYSINLMNADGTNVRQLTTLSLTIYLLGMSWSPDGAKLAFQDSTDIFTINVDGSNRVNLTGGQFINSEPSWSPDGARITFSRSTLPHGGYKRVYVMNADGSNVSQITNCLGYCEQGSPDWSPDGGRIAFYFNGDSDYDGYTIGMVDPDGTDLQHINSENIQNPKWSPDGTKIVSYGGGYSNIPSQIWVIDRDGSGSTQLTNASPNNFHPDWQPLVVNVANIEELYSAVNNAQNAGTSIIIAPGVYLLSVNDPNGVARPNSGRLELQENMSMQGVVGDRNAVVIDAMNLPASSYNNAPPIPLTAAIRMGRGTNAIEWLTVRNAVNGAANIETDLLSTGTVNIRIAHIASSGGQRGIDVRNFGVAMAGRVIQAEIVDNDLFGHIIGLGEGLRFVNNLGATGGVITATISDNRSHNNFIGLLIENNRSNLANITVNSTNDWFFENGNGALVGGGLSAATTAANGNTVTFTAVGTKIENNNGFNVFDLGGLIIVGGENTSFPNGTSNNTVNVELRGCRLAFNQQYDLLVIAARSNPASIGTPGMNNHVNVTLLGMNRRFVVEGFINSIPEFPGGMNTVTVTRWPKF